MAQIDIPAAVDDQLRSIAPEYLRSKRDRARRARWAIDEYLKLIRAFQPKEPENESGTARNAGAAGEGDGA